MGRLFPFRGKSFLLFLSLLLALAGVGWWQRTPLLAWYYVRGLAGAADDERATWVERVSSLDTGSVPGLLGCLRRENPRVCVNAEAALVHLVGNWGNGEPRTLGLAEQVAECYPGLSVCGQQCALELALVLLKRQPAAAQALGRALAVAAQAKDAGVQARALALAEVLMENAASGLTGDTLRGLVAAGLKNPDPACRFRAVHLTLHEALREDSDLRAQVVPLLRDPQTAVRRAALLAVGMAEQTISEDALLPLLHDPDADVRRLCEGALRSRGLCDDHLMLARLISDARPSARLEVLDGLTHATDLEPGAWLRRLSRDPSPAVRAAAVRAAAAQTQVDLSARLHQLAQDDPSPTVRQLAFHYCQVHLRALAVRP